MEIPEELKKAVIEIIAQKLAELLIPIPNIPDPETLKKIRKDTREKLEGLKEEMKKQPEGMIYQMAQQLQEKVTENYKKFNTNLGLLTTCVIQLIPRMAGYITDMIGSCAVGPTVNINKIPTIIQQLQSEAQVLAKAYDDVETSFKDLVMGLNPEKDDELKNGPVGKLIALVSTALGTAASILAIFGISRGGQEAKELEIESPVEPEEYLASDCSEYIADEEHSGFEPGTNPPTLWEPKCEYCTKFVPMVPEKFVFEFSDDPETGKTAQEQYDEWYASWLEEKRSTFTCNDCKFYKKK